MQDRLQHSSLPYGFLQSAQFSNLFLYNICGGFEKIGYCFSSENVLEFC